MSRCPHPECDREKPFNQYACRPHWFSLPKEIRDRIWKGFKYDRRVWDQADADARAWWDARILKRQEEDKQGSLFG